MLTFTDVPLGNAAVMVAIYALADRVDAVDEAGATANNLGGPVDVWVYATSKSDDCMPGGTTGLPGTAGAVRWMVLVLAVLPALRRRRQPVS